MSREERMVDTTGKRVFHTTTCHNMIVRVRGRRCECHPHIGLATDASEVVAG
jgi:hypothetical protein